LAHERVVALALGLLAERRRQREVQVAGRRVARDAGQEAVLAQQRAQVLGALGDSLRAHADVLGDQRGARRAEPADDTEHPLANGPVLLGQLVVARPARPLERRVILENAGSLRLEPVEAGLVVAAQLYQQQPGVVGYRVPFVRHAGEDVPRDLEPRREHQLDRTRADADQPGYRAGGRVEV